MRRSRHVLFGGACALAIAAAGSARAADDLAQKAAERPASSSFDAARQALVGEWQVNAALSDDPRAKMRDGGGSRCCSRSSGRTQAR
jgi:hypothetical protein